MKYGGKIHKQFTVGQQKFRMEVLCMQLLPNWPALSVSVKIARDNY